MHVFAIDLILADPACFAMPLKERTPVPFPVSFSVQILPLVNPLLCIQLDCPSGKAREYKMGFINDSFTN